MAKKATRRGAESFAGMGIGDVLSLSRLSSPCARGESGLPDIKQHRKAAHDTPDTAQPAAPSFLRLSHASRRVCHCHVFKPRPELNSSRGRGGASQSRSTEDSVSCRVVCQCQSVYHRMQHIYLLTESDSQSVSVYNNNYKYS